jgi:hypothetical protein
VLSFESDDLDWTSKCDCSIRLNGFWRMTKKWVCSYSGICGNMSARCVGNAGIDLLNRFDICCKAVV